MVLPFLLWGASTGQCVCENVHDCATLYLRVYVYTDDPGCPVKIRCNVINAVFPGSSISLARTSNASSDRGPDPVTKYTPEHTHSPPIVLPDTGRGPVRQSQSSWCWDTSSPTRCLGGGHSGRSHAQISSHCTSSPSSEKSGEREGEISVVQEMMCLCVCFHSTIQYS